MHQIKYQKAALKGLRKMPKPMAMKFRVGFESIVSGDVNHLDIKALSGRDGFRLRIGQYRGIFEILNSELVVSVLNVGPRGDIYKK